MNINLVLAWGARQTSDDVGPFWKVAGFEVEAWNTLMLVGDRVYIHARLKTTILLAPISSLFFCNLQILLYSSVHSYRIV